MEAGISRPPEFGRPEKGYMKPLPTRGAEGLLCTATMGG
jgi:hypothetical protein